MKVIFEAKLVRDDGVVLNDFNAEFLFEDMTRYLWTTIGLELCAREMIADRQCYGSEKDAHKLDVKAHNVVANAMRRYKQNKS